MEPNRVEYTRKIQLLKIKDGDSNDDKIKNYPRYKQYLKYSISILILILMVTKIIALKNIFDKHKKKLLSSPFMCGKYLNAINKKILCIHNLL